MKDHGSTPASFSHSSTPMAPPRVVPSPSMASSSMAVRCARTVFFCTASCASPMSPASRRVSRARSLETAPRDSELTMRSRTSATSAACASGVMRALLSRNRDSPRRRVICAGQLGSVDGPGGNPACSPDAMSRCWFPRYVPPESLLSDQPR